ncbi:MAG: hypothetical protein ACC653_10445 [Gammaproteobacteria bacterium]
MHLDSTVYEITLIHNGNKHVVESLCLEMTDVTLIKAIKSAVSSLKSQGLKGAIKYDSHRERSLLPDFK